MRKEEEPLYERNDTPGIWMSEFRRFIEERKLALKEIDGAISDLEEAKDWICDSFLVSWKVMGG